MKLTLLVVRYSVTISLVMLSPKMIKLCEELSRLMKTYSYCWLKGWFRERQYPVTKTMVGFRV